MPRDKPPAMDEPLIRVEVDACAIAVRGVLADIRSQWRVGAVDPDLCRTGELVLAEVLNNVVEHAQAGRMDGVIRLQIAAGPGQLTCLVQDDGCPMPEGKLPAGRMARIGKDIDSLPEGGFGWNMIRTLTRDLEYRRIDNWNHLSFAIDKGFVPQ
ncbi:MAG: ATP-binding protein [Rhodobacteraceae bacterium]|nr:ATP-binding protein [Paracoccaceae bacterium]